LRRIIKFGEKLQPRKNVATAGPLYVKFTADLLAEFLLLSFKEKENG
jgi:hypothetical protein